MSNRGKLNQSAGDLSSSKHSIKSLKLAAKDCRACDLWENATQTVFGEGPVKARILLIGEQPGNDEDLSGKPFVGPAGKLLDKALAEVGLDRGEIYVTNVVKHFKWERRGKLRIHKKPNSEEIHACSPWLGAEMATIKPAAIMLLGATAAQAVLGKQFRVTQSRGKLLESKAAIYVMATVHPSSILRAPKEKRDSEYKNFVADLKKLASLFKIKGRK